jgi:dUTP pyrophosphatase
MRPKARLPVRAHQMDAGMDLFYCPNGEKKLYDSKDFFIPPKESRLIPTGIKVEIPYGYMLEIKNKSGIAYKRQLIVGACVVDPGYNGEVYVNLHNIGAETQMIRPGDKVAQAILIPIVHCKVEEVESDEFLNFHSKRGEGGFGSTGER